MDVHVSASVLNDLDNFDSVIRQRLISRLTVLKKFPNVSGLKSLKGFHRTFRLRMGDYRIVFVVDTENDVITVLAIGHRKDIYKKFLKKQLR